MFILTVCLWCCGAVLFPSAAAAHAVLVEASPAKDEVVAERPAEVRLVFDQEVSVADDGVSVLDPTGTRVDDGTSGSGSVVTTRVRAGDRGTYTVVFRVVSADGHVIVGSHVFHVGTRSGGASVDLSGPWTIGVLGWLGRAGMWLAAMAVIGRSVVVGWARHKNSGGGAVAGVSEWVPTRWWWWAVSVVGAFGAGAEVVARAASQRGGGVWSGVGGVARVVETGRPGVVLVARATLILVLAVVVHRRGRRWSVVAGAVAAASLVIAPFGGHPSTTDPVPLAVTLDMLHVLAVALWVGGLVVVSLGARGLPDGGLRRFSTTALVAAPVVLVTGLAAAWLQARGWRAVTSTSSGRLLIAKTVGGVGLLVLGARHRRTLNRLVEAGLAGLRAEALLGVAVLGVAAVLVAVPPASELVTNPVRAVKQAGDRVVVLDVVPGRRGVNDVHLYFQNRDGQVVSVDAAELQVTGPGAPARKVQLTMVGPGHAAAVVDLPLRGDWTMRVALIDRGRPASTEFEVPVP